MTEKKYPVRKCVSCGERKYKDELVRIVKTESGAEIDLTGKQSGRGCYVCKNADCIKNAKKARRIERALSSTVSEEVYKGLSALTEDK